jgi:hypothetical protein
LADAFWYTMAYVVQKAAASRSPDGYLQADKSPHISRMSRNYVRILKRVPVNKLPSFKQHYEGLLAFGLILCYQASFPHQIESFQRVEFVQKIIDLCMEWIRGFRPAKTRWTAKSAAWLRQRVTDRHQDLAKLLVNGGPGGKQGVRNHPHYTPLLTRRVKYRMQHSPLIERYKNLVGEKDRPHLACQMTWTEDPESPLKNMVYNDHDYKSMKLRPMSRARTVPVIPEVIRESLAVRRKVFQEYMGSRTQYTKDVRAIRQGDFSFASERPLTKEMEALVMAGDVHELSNYLTVTSRVSVQQPVSASKNKPLKGRHA